MVKIENVISIREMKFVPVIVDVKGWDREREPTKDYCKFCMFASRNKFGQLIEASCTIHKLHINCGVRYCGYYTDLKDGV